MSGGCNVLQVWETVKGFNWRHGETYTDPFHPFEHPLAEWHHYSPSNRENYFGQVCTSCKQCCQVCSPCMRTDAPMHSSCSAKRQASPLITCIAWRDDTAIDLLLRCFKLSC